MKLLVLGGTRFIGRHMTEAALAAGHRVTLFHRGKTGADLFPGAERITGDRRKDLGRLGGRSWDAVVDLCGYKPEEVAESSRALAGRVGLYVFVSTVSVYRDWGLPGMDENAPLREPGGDDYGAQKVACERAFAAAPERSLIVRPGLVAGPWDPTDRFTYWPLRVAAGGEVLAPGSPARIVQVIDARDLAAWMLRMTEAGSPGIFNAAGPGAAMQDVLDACREATGSGASFTWVDAAFLEGKGVQPWREMPLWIPGVDDTFDSGRARRAGLLSRPLAQTVRDTWTWAREHRARGGLECGLDARRERDLLASWKSSLQRSPS